MYGSFLIYLCLFCRIFCGTTRWSADDDYYLNYDYDLNNSSENVDVKSDSLILPNPEKIDNSDTPDVLPTVELPDDSLADPDLKDHDLIDSITYIYYGPQKKSPSLSYSIFLFFGAASACLSQSLMVFYVLLRKSDTIQRQIKYIFLSAIINMCISNILFMFEIYISEYNDICSYLGLAICYSETTAALWFLFHAAHLNSKLLHSKPMNMKLTTSLAYAIPILLTIAMHYFQSQRANLKETCFSTLNRFSLYFICIIITALASTQRTGLDEKVRQKLSEWKINISINSLRAINCDLEIGHDLSVSDGNEEVVMMVKYRDAVYWSCNYLALHVLNGTILQVATEGIRDSFVMPVVYIFSTSVLNWMTLLRIETLIPTGMDEELLKDSDFNDKFDTDMVNNNEDDSIDTSIIIRRDSSDNNVPLLMSTDDSAKMTELKSICTISY